MNIIVCVDDRFGMAFAGRRQSRDRLQIERMLETVGENKLFISEYTAKLFEILPDNVAIVNDFSDIPENAFCFIENVSANDIIQKAEQIVLYRWNRVYPSDVEFPKATLEGKTLVSTFDFKGHSHEIITEEVYK